MATWWEVVVPAVSGLVGAVVGGGVTLGVQGLTLWSDRAARRQDRDLQLTDERRAYELARMEELRGILGVVNESHSHASRLLQQRRIESGMLAPMGEMSRLLNSSSEEPLDPQLAAEFAPAVLRLRGAALVVLDEGVRESCLKVADSVTSSSSNRQSLIDEAYRRIGQRTRELYNPQPGIERGGDDA